MQITAPRPEPLEEIEAMPEPEGWVTHYSTSDFDYRVNLSARQCISTYYLGEAVPSVAPDLMAESDGTAGITQLGVGGLSMYYDTDEAVEGKNAFLEKRKPDFHRFRK